VIVVDDAKTGSRAIVTLRDPGRAGEVHNLMGRYTMAFEIKEGRQ
jgi:hypothetical protein